MDGWLVGEVMNGDGARKARKDYKPGRRLMAGLKFYCHCNGIAT